METNYYICDICEEEWNFYPEDYDWEEDTYPCLCPLCEMPITQMIKDVWEHEGFSGIPLMLKIIYKKI